MRRIVWRLNGCTEKFVRGYGAHVQDAFTRLGRRERQLITLYCVRVEVG